MKQKTVVILTYLVFVFIIIFVYWIIFYLPDLMDINLC